MPGPRRPPFVPHTVVLLVAAAAALSALACSAGTPGVAPAGRHPNVLLLTVDTLRPDHLGCLGYKRDTSPNIDALAKRGVIFRQAITAAGRTVQSFPSILTGVYPPVHGLRHEGQDSTILEGRLTLTRVLRDAGYDTFAVTQGLNVGLHRDFHMYDPDIYLGPNGEKVYRPSRDDRDASVKAIAWLRSRRGNPRPFFLWMRYDAPHWPYVAPPPFGEKFDPAYTGPHTFNAGQKPEERRGDIIFGLTKLSPREVEHAVAHYDGEVAYSDQAIGDLMKAIDAMGESARTVVLVTADHGEGLGEHDYFFEHGAYLYEPVVRVPFIVAAPGRLPEGKIIEPVVRTIDIMPTLIDLAGLPVPGGLQGRSLVPLARGEDHGPSPPAYCESGRNYFKENPRQYIEGTAGKWRMMRDDRFKLILIPRDPDPVWEFYDLAADPGETTNVIDRFPQDVARLRAALMAIVDADPGRNDREEPPIPDELEERLHSLGYVGGGSDRP
jgi:arylsulfatase A-like enzyme